MKKILTIVVPCYNESEAFYRTNTVLTNVINEMILEEIISPKSHVLYVDDGSHDDTWEKITNAKSVHVKGLKLSRNCGHQAALLAGLEYSTGDITISIDADLQDDVNVIKDMINKNNCGCEVVYGVREDRSSDSFFKRLTANVFYESMSKMGVEQIKNHADYRLLSRQAVNALLKFKESNIYIRGIIPKLGFKTDCVFYKRLERLEGESKYPLRKMISLAIQGITSNTILPLRAIAMAGIITSSLSFFAILVIVLQKFLGHTVNGWASISVGMFFLGGVQMLFLGIIGEYIGKIYIETKKRPRYFVEDMF